MSTVSSVGDGLAEELAGWPVGSAEVIVVDRSDVLGAAGDVNAVRPWASVTKLLSALAVLRTAADGDLDLDEPAGPPGATVRHLLAHASGLATDSDKLLAEPGRRRVYSNRGIEVLAEHVAARVGRSFDELVSDTVLEPLAMSATTMSGSPAHGAVGPVSDLAALACELISPRILPKSLVATATTTVFPGLAGVLPGFGRQVPNDWGLGFEIRAHKAPHWTASHNSPRTFGHFGQSGAFLWIDPDAGLGCVCTSDTPFGPWSGEHWPALSTRVLQLARTP